MKQIKPARQEELALRNSGFSSQASDSEQNCFQIEVPSSQKDFVHRDSIETFGPQSVSPSFAMANDSIADLNSAIKLQDYN